MEKKLENQLDEFLYDEELETQTKNQNKGVILNQREGLVERIDKVFVTEDGRQLLREQY